ncbi:hypothetical protein PS3A_10410 [Pseudomonas sp. 3A(2025)]
MKTFFEDLMESVQQMDEIVSGRSQPSRTFMKKKSQAKSVRKAGENELGQRLPASIKNNL